MALEMDMERKPTPTEWLAGDPWFEGALRGTYAAFREGYRQAYDAGARRFGLSTSQAGPQIRGAQ